MSVLIGFIPWWSYWIFISFGKIELAMWVAFVSSLVLCLKEFEKKSQKILTTGTSIFFFLMVLLVTLTKPFWLWREIGLMGNMALVLITLISLLIRKPFTMQYAMETVPKERWNTPGFLRTNNIITSAWLIAFLFMSIPALADLFGASIPIWGNWIFSLACFAGAMTFTEWYKNTIRKRSG